MLIVEADQAGLCVVIAAEETDEDKVLVFEKVSATVEYGGFGFKFHFIGTYKNNSSGSGAEAETFLIVVNKSGKSGRKSL